VQDQRDARYNLLRGYFHGVDDDSVDELQLDRLSSLTLGLGAKSIGKPLSFFELQIPGVRVISLRRKNGKTVSLADDPALEDGDILVLSGQAEALARAEEKLFKG
jgi:CPA2 family monovalent cation:H+ antiporter-2